MQHDHFQNDLIEKNWLRLIFPKFCLTCSTKIPMSKQISDFCPECLLHLPWTNHTCYRCGLPTTVLDDWRTCEYCRENPPVFDRLFAPFFYQPPISNLVMQLKFSRNKILAKILYNLFIKNYFAKMVIDQDQMLHTPQIIVPMPLHPKRLRQRGYNQAYELSRFFAKPSRKNPLFIPVNERLVWRKKETAAQSTLNKQERQHNIKDAFAVSPEIAEYQQVVIFDDVVTTGTTANAVAKVIKDAGVDQVDIWCICRA